jgi:glutamyl-tRNA(Gln) amidotransferase subunit D
MNLICASHLITKSDLGEVVIVMHESMDDNYCIAIRGCRCRKMHTSRRDAFKSINENPIAKISYSGEIQMINKNYMRKKEGKVVVDDRLEEKVAFVKVYPGIDPEIFDFYLEKKYKGFVIEGTGLGHVPTFGKDSVLNKIKKIREKGIPVVITSQCIYGRVHPTIYANLRKLFKLGVIFAEDMLPEVAYIKLMFVLGHTKDEEKLKTLMLKNLAGEISERSE